jgi:hypothetical protein
MIGKNFKFKGLDMSDTQAQDNRFVINEVNKNISLRTTIINKQNYH